MDTYKHCQRAHLLAAARTSHTKGLKAFSSKIKSTCKENVVFYVSLAQGAADSIYMERVLDRHKLSIRHHGHLAAILLLADDSLYYHQSNIYLDFDCYLVGRKHNRGRFKETFRRPNRKQQIASEPVASWTACYAGETSVFNCSSSHHIACAKG